MFLHVYYVLYMYTIFFSCTLYILNLFYQIDSLTTVIKDLQSNVTSHTDEHKIATVRYI